MATLNPKTEAEALVTRLRADAQDIVEARIMFFAAMSVLQYAVQAASVEAEEAKAGHILTSRAATPGGKSVVTQKADVALLLGKHPSTVTAVEVTEAIFLASKP